MQNYKTKALVTGHMGFIGSHLSTRLNELDFEVLGADIKASEPIDIRDFNSIDKLCQGADVIFHLAAISSEQECVNDPAKAVSVNIDGTETIFKAAKKNKCKILFASSAGVYGASEVPCKESMRTNPHGIYASTKKQGEGIALKYKFDVNSVCARMFNVYGPGGHGVVNKFISECESQRIEVTNGKQVRDFIYIDDVINAFIGLYDNCLNSELYYAPIEKYVNIGTGSGTSIDAIADVILGLNKINPKHRYYNDEDPGCLYSVANIDKLRQILPNFMPRNILMGLREII